MVHKKANWKAPLLVGGTGLLGGISTYALARALGLGKGWSTALAIPAGVATGIGVGNVADRLIEDRTAGVRKELVDENKRAHRLSKTLSRISVKATQGPDIRADEWDIINVLMNDEPELLKRLHQLYDYRNRLHVQGMNADVFGGTK